MDLLLPDLPRLAARYAEMDIGRENGAVVDRDYENKKPFAFRCTAKKVVFDITPTSLTRTNSMYTLPTSTVGQPTRCQSGQAPRGSSPRSATKAADVQSTSRCPPQR